MTPERETAIRACWARCSRTGWGHIIKTGALEAVLYWPPPPLAGYGEEPVAMDAVLEKIVFQARFDRAGTGAWVITCEGLTL